MSVLDQYHINSNDWHYYGLWEQALFSGSFWAHWYDENLQKALALSPVTGKIILLNGHHIIWKQDIEKLKNILTQAINNKDKNFFIQLVDETKNICRRHEMECNNATSGPDQLSALESFVISAKRLMTPWFVGLILSDAMDDILASEAQRAGCSLADLIAHIPKKETLMIQEQRAAMKLRQALTNAGWRKYGDTIAPDLDNHIESHIHTYQWVGTHHFWGDPLSKKKFLGDIWQLPEYKISSPKLLPKELDFVLWAAGELMWLRQYVPEIFAIGAFRVRPLMSAIANHLDLTYQEFLLFSPNEIIYYLREKKQPTPEYIARRKNGYGIFLDDSQTEIIIDTASDLLVLEQTFVPEVNGDLVMVRGIVASPGHARGPAKIFLTPTDLQKMNHGDVLITPMTSPDFIPLMKKASGIVTDIGGLLSHAALVSRELDIPCVIGTKVATKVFKDGDMVEVDADKGIVTKLSP